MAQVYIWGEDSSGNQDFYGPYADEAEARASRNGILLHTGEEGRLLPVSDMTPQELSYLSSNVVAAHPDHNTVDMSSHTETLILGDHADVTRPEYLADVDAMEAFDDEVEEILDEEEDGEDLWSNYSVEVAASYPHFMVGAFTASLA